MGVVMMVIIVQGGERDKTRVSAEVTGYGGTGGHKRCLRPVF
jgi:hypothetical protein